MPNRIIRLDPGGAVVAEDHWRKLAEDADDAGADADGVLLPLDLWRRRKAAGESDDGVWLRSDQTGEELGEDCERLRLIAIEFPAFRDGRGFSTARKLREAYRYRGELRALGNFIPDQLFYMMRCGFDSFQPENWQRPLESGLRHFADFGECYQAAVKPSEALYDRRRGD